MSFPFILFSASLSPSNMIVLEVEERGGVPLLPHQGGQHHVLGAERPAAHRPRRVERRHNPCQSQRRADADAGGVDPPALAQLLLEGHALHPLVVQRREGEGLGEAVAQVAFAEEAVGSAIAICGVDVNGVDGVDTMGMGIGIGLGR